MNKTLTRVVVVVVVGIAATIVVADTVVTKTQNCITNGVKRLKGL